MSRKFPTMLIAAAAVMVAVTLGACASAPKTYANADSTVDFSRYRTFGFFDRLATDKKGYESLESRYLKDAAIREMSRRGLTQAENPQLKINFHINTKEKLVSRQTPTVGGYYGYRGPYYGAWGGYETRIDQYTEGTINVDVVDTTTSTLVWEGIIVGRVNEDALNHLEEAMHASVHEIFKKFPIKPVTGTERT